ncbi:MAG: hypothetical protein EOP53_03895 [Sphingobacteriales bacterium]|nr:MAG: hypothetical protein EOP53_03895 [Sphingobacteriales bacterium]
MKKIILVFGIWFCVVFGFSILQSCQTCDPGGPYNYYIASLSSELKEITGTQKVDSSEYIIVNQNVIEQKALKYDSFVMEVKHKYESYIRYKNPSLFAFTGTLACSPVENWDDLQEVIITSSANFDSNHPAGTNLSDIVLYRESYDIAGTKASEAKRTLYGSFAFLSFSMPPAADGLHEITIKYILANGKELITQLNNVNIKK